MDCMEDVVVLIPCVSKYSFTKVDFWAGALSCNKWYPGYQCVDGHCCNVSGRLLYTLTYSYKLTRASTLRQKRWFQFPHCEHSICSYTFQQHLHMKYISQLIRYSRTCGSSNEFIYREVLLTRKLLDQEFIMVMLKSLLRTFHGRHHINRNCISV